MNQQNSTAAEKLPNWLRLPLPNASPCQNVHFQKWSQIQHVNLYRLNQDVVRLNVLVRASFTVLSLFQLSECKWIIQWLEVSGQTSHFGPGQIDNLKWELKLMVLKIHPLKKGCCKIANLLLKCHRTPWIFENYDLLPPVLNAWF